MLDRADYERKLAEQGAAGLDAEFAAMTRLDG
jgi:hypothetical protein